MLQDKSKMQLQMSGKSELWKQVTWTLV